MKLVNFLIPTAALVTAISLAFVLTTVSATDVPAEPATPYIQAAQILAYGKPERLRLRSQVALIMDEREGVVLYERAPATSRPIASLTKLMTALVVLESDPAMDEGLAITQDDRDRPQGHVRGPVGREEDLDSLPPRERQHHAARARRQQQRASAQPGERQDP